MIGRLFSLALAVLLVVIHPTPSIAQWQSDGAPIATWSISKSSPAILADGAGGAFVAFLEIPYNGRVVVQKVSAAGAPMWGGRGVIVGGGQEQWGAKLVSDGAGGVIVAWIDYRSFASYDIYAQRINAAGSLQWPSGGVPVCTAAGDQTNASVVADASGGAIVTWHDYRSGTADIYAQRVSSAGTALWTANGVVLCNATGSQLSPLAATDGAGGMIAAWQDSRAGNVDVYAQRITASGIVQWAANGVNLMTAFGANVNQYVSGIVSDGAGGAIATWQDYRYGNYDVFANRVSSTGVVMWTTFGAQFTGLAADQLSTTIVTDGAGGAIIGWYDSSQNIYAGRVDAAGIPMWASEGVAICTAPNQQTDPVMVSDGAGGAIVSWRDRRSGVDNDIYAQHISAAGVTQWTPNGVAVCTAVADQSIPVVASNGSGGAILAWTDFRSGSYLNDIYAQRIEAKYGYWGRPEPVISAVADIRHDQGGKVSVDWMASGRDQAIPRTIDHYSIWRAVNSIPAASALSDFARVSADATGPTYADLTPAADYYWELVGTQGAHSLPGYSLAAPTRADSVASATGTEQFMVLAHDQTDDYIAFMSNVMSGHSVDNLAPAAPLLLIAQRAGANVLLHWNGVHVPDLRDYSIYRATASGVTPVPINFLSSSDDTVAVDPNAPTSGLYYIVTAYDVHANQSAPSNEAHVGPFTGIGNTPPISDLTVLQNYPNPFASTTDMSIGLPATADVHIDVFDVGGRRVGSLEAEKVAAGWRTFRFSSQDDRGRPLASGVYFYRVEAGGSTVTRKMIIAR